MPGNRFDEATAFIDPRTRKDECGFEVIAGKTVLVIAHRLHTIKNADKICVLNQGNIAAEGTRRTLRVQKNIAACGRPRKKRCMEVRA